MEKLQIDIGVQSGKGDYGEQGNLKIGYLLTAFYLRQECSGGKNFKRSIYREQLKISIQEDIIDGVLDRLGARDNIHT